MKNQDAEDRPLRDSRVETNLAIPGVIGLSHKFDGVQPLANPRENSKNGLKQPMRKRIDTVGR